MVPNGFAEFESANLVSSGGSTPGFITVTLIVTNNLLLQSPDGGAAMGGIAAHGYVNGKAGAARQG